MRQTGSACLEVLGFKAPVPPVCPACRWESSGFFAPDPNAHGPAFTMPMPPPNVTGKLHMGHAMFVTLQVRFVACQGLTYPPSIWGCRW
jgi:hypothetical protein